MISNGHQTYFLTGAAGGIGRYIADKLIARGDRVFATDVSVDSLREHARSAGWPDDRAYVATLDVRTPQGWDDAYAEAMQAFGGIDVHMNIAGVLLPDFVHEASDDEINLQVDVNLKGVIWGTRIAAQHMIARGGKGHIVNIASISGVAPIPGLDVYSATKFGVRGFSLAAALGLRKHGVKLTVICPDAIDTGLLVHSRSKDAGALIFSASQLLTVDEIGRIVFERVLPDKPLEVVYPRGRAWLARIGSMFPNLGRIVLGGMARRGISKQRRMGWRATS